MDNTKTIKGYDKLAYISYPAWLCEIFDAIPALEVYSEVKVSELNEVTLFLEKKHQIITFGKIKKMIPILEKWGRYFSIFTIKNQMVIQF